MGEFLLSVQGWHQEKPTSEALEKKWAQWGFEALSRDYFYWNGFVLRKGKDRELRDRLLTDTWGWPDISASCYAQTGFLDHTSKPLIPQTKVCPGFSAPSWILACRPHPALSSPEIKTDDCHYPEQSHTGVSILSDHKQRRQNTWTISVVDNNSLWGFVFLLSTASIKNTSALWRRENTMAFSKSWQSTEHSIMKFLFVPVFPTAGSISVPCRWLSSMPGNHIANKSSLVESEKGPSVLCLEIRNDLCLKSLPSLAENSVLHSCKHVL